MYQNNLTQKYQGHMNQPIKYMNSNMFNNNPIYASNIYDQNFYRQMMVQKEEQQRRVKSVSDLGLTKEQITEYVIAPIKIAKNDSREIEKLINDERALLTKEFIEKNWWKSRTNAPYKNILKNENWKKDFKSKEDLIVYKTNASDKDRIELEGQYKKLQKLLEHHNGELSVIFSASNENEYKQKFKHVQKYRDRLKHDPKNYTELKDYYKKEQKKHEREQKRIDNIIARIMDDDIDDKELKQIETELCAKKNKVEDDYYDEEDRHVKELDEKINKLISEGYADDMLECKTDKNTENKKVRILKIEPKKKEIPDDISEPVVRKIKIKPNTASNSKDDINTNKEVSQEKIRKIRINYKKNID
jgi:hypothetical protein